MELIKELPEVFEEFAEQRQKSFLAMKGLKDQGVPVVGAYCTCLLYTSPSPRDCS
mgnify:CR=1 FL=1